MHNSVICHGPHHTCLIHQTNYHTSQCSFPHSLHKRCMQLTHTLVFMLSSSFDYGYLRILDPFYRLLSFLILNQKKLLSQEQCYFLKDTFLWTTNTIIYPCVIFLGPITYFMYKPNAYIINWMLNWMFNLKISLWPFFQNLGFEHLNIHSCLIVKKFTLDN